MTTHRLRTINQYYSSGNRDATFANDAADEIIAQPDSHLLSQSDLWEAEGGANTFALSLGVAAVGAFAAMGVNPRIGAHLKSGNLNFYEWLSLGGASAFGYYAGNALGVSSFGDANKVQAHWMAYTYVKAQNRYQGRNILGKTPYY